MDPDEDIPTPVSYAPTARPRFKPPRPPRQSRPPPPPRPSPPPPPPPRPVTQQSINEYHVDDTSTGPPRPPPRPVPQQSVNGYHADDTSTDNSYLSSAERDDLPTQNLNAGIYLIKDTVDDGHLLDNNYPYFHRENTVVGDSTHTNTFGGSIRTTPLFHPLASFRRAPHSNTVQLEHTDERRTKLTDSVTFPHDTLAYSSDSCDDAKRIPDIIYGEDTWTRHVEVVNPYATHRRTSRTFPRLNLERHTSTVSTTTGCTTFADSLEDTIAGTIEVFHERNPGDESIVGYVQAAVRHGADSSRDGTEIEHSDSEDNSAHKDKGVRRWRVKEKCVNSRLNADEVDTNVSDDVQAAVSKTADEDEVEDTDVDNKGTFFYCRWITNYPVLSFALTFSGQVSIIMVTVALLLLNYDLFPTEFELLPMSDHKVPWLKRDLAWTYRDDFGPEIGARYVRKWYLQGVDKWFRSMAYGRANIVLYYDTGDGNVFDKNKLMRIQEIEDRITGIPEYEKFCVQTPLLQCEKPLSILRFFDGTLAILDPVFKDPYFDNIPAVLHAARTNNYTKSEFAFFLSKGSSIGPTQSKGPVTRTIVPMGYPLLPGQKKESMEEEMKQFLTKQFKPVVEKLQQETSKFSLVYWSYILFRSDIVKQVAVDAMFALGSILFILAFIIYHTKSLWVSMLGVFSILTSFLCANMVYRIVLDFRYFGFFHVIALFIILGIGADDLFVFIDVWKATAYKRYPSLAHRLSDAYRKSMLSMLFTSVTTTAAFLASAVSPLLAPLSFGVFAAVLVFVNFISVIFYFPTVIVIHHLYFQHRKWPCCSWPKFNCLNSGENEHSDVNDNSQSVWCKDIFDDNTAVGTAGNSYDVIGRDNPAYTNDNVGDEYGFIRGSDAKGTTTEYTNHTAPVLKAANGHGVELNVKTDTKPKPKQRKILVRFFRDHYFRFITHWVIRWIIIVLLMSVVLFFSFCASKIETENEQAKFYRSTHNYGRALELDFHGFVASKQDRNVVLYIVWGLQERDMSGCHFSDARCKGTEKFDSTFNPNSPEAQMALKRFCDHLYNFTSEEIDRFKINRDVVTRQPEIKCFTKPLERFLKSEAVSTGHDMSLPWNYSKAINVMQSLVDIYSTNRMDTEFANELEIPISYWLNNGYRFENKTDFNTYHSLIGESISKYSTPVKTDMSVFYGNKIVYMGVQVNLTLGRYTSGYPEGKPALDAWETFVQDQMRQMPPGLQNGFQVTHSFWHSISIQKTMADNAIFGVVVGVLLAFPILTIATQNIVIGFFATFSMCCSTICVIGVIPLAGWRLGLIESLNICMVVGLSVDYVVHLAEGYHMSKHEDRKSRVQDMLEVMGISVFSGACTTLGASVFMFFAQILFIVRFGMFMFCTIGFSLVFSLGLFATLMGILGPSGNTGDIVFMFKFLKGKLTRTCTS